MTNNTITGRAKKFDGTAIDYVSIFNWADGKCIAQVIPDDMGNWTFSYYQTLIIGITYVADGCEPITHGAYEFIHQNLGHKWWRVSNIKISAGAPANWKRGSVAELRFNTVSGILSNIPAKGMSAHQSASSNAASAAFDGNPSTFAYSSSAIGNTLENWWIGYEFEKEEIVTSVSIQNPDWTSGTQKQAWQTADIDVSSDGITWVKYGTIAPMMVDADKSVVTTPIIHI